LWPPVDNRTYAEPEPAELAYGRVFFDLKQLNTAIAAELFPNVDRGDRRTAPTETCADIVIGWWLWKVWLPRSN
jgi:hypothetical protein